MKIIIEPRNEFSDDNLTGAIRVVDGMIQIQYRQKEKYSQDVQAWKQAESSELSINVYEDPPTYVYPGTITTTNAFHEET